MFFQNLYLVKLKSRTRTIYDYKNVDIQGLIKYIKEYYFENTVFCHPVLRQTEIFNNNLTDAFSKLVPCKLKIQN